MLIRLVLARHVAFAVLCTGASLTTFGQEPVTATGTAEEPPSFELIVVGPQGESVPAAVVEVRSQQKAWQIHVGEVIRDGTYGVFMKTNEQGRLKLVMPKEKLGFLNLSIEAPGYGLFWAAWSFSQKSEQLPASYTAHLDAGQSFGGVVVDSDGKPVADAQVHPSIEYKKRDGDLGQLGSGKRYKTDAQGGWRVDTVPASEERLHVQIVHPNFMPTSLSLNATEYGLKLDEIPSRPMALERGQTVAGVVSDLDGKPIAGAIVRAHIQNETLEAIADAAGRYALKNCQMGTTELVVTAQGFAPDLKQVDIRESTPAVDFRLEPGRTLRVRVTDREGNPLPRARIFFQNWRGKSHDEELGMVHAYTDETGIWLWENAPADAVTADICPPKAMQIPDQVLVAREEEFLFTATPLLSIRGRVVDADTDEPVKEFRVIPGMRWPGRTDPFWMIRDSFDGADGKFSFTESRVEGAFLMRIEAAGYAPLTSRDIAWDEGEVKFKYPLKKAEDIAFQVLGPDGSLAVKAVVVLAIAGSQVMLRNGEFTSQTYATRGTTDAQGQISFRPQATAYKLFVTHETGYAELELEPTQQLQEIQLTAWGRVTGNQRIGKSVAANVPLVLYPDSTYSPAGLPNASHRYTTQTDEQGRFVFERVLPGLARLGREITTHRSNSSARTSLSHAELVEVEPGRTLEVELGGTGLALIGVLLPPRGIKEAVNWEFSRVDVQEDIGLMQPIPYPANMQNEDDRNAWLRTWLTTPDGQRWSVDLEVYQARQRKLGRFSCGVNQDGSFRIDDLPPGNYVLSAELNQPTGGGRVFQDRPIGELKLPLQLSPPDTDQTIVDLGRLAM